MKAIINAFFNLFTEDKPEVVVPVKLSWDARKKLANAAIDRGLLKVHTASRASVLAKLEMAAHLRKQVEESYTKHSDATFEMVMRSVRSFDRVGY